MYLDKLIGVDYENLSELQLAIMELLPGTVTFSNPRPIPYSSGMNMEVDFGMEDGMEVRYMEKPDGQCYLYAEYYIDDGRLKYNLMAADDYDAAKEAWEEAKRKREQACDEDYAPEEDGISDMDYWPIC